MEQFNSTLSILGGIAITIAASLGIGNLLLAIYQRRASNRDKREAIHESNHGAQLDHDDKFQERLLHRVETLEAQIAEMQVEQVAQARLHAALELENTALKKENEQQEREIIALRATDEERLERIRHLETQVAELSEAVELLNKRSSLNAAELKVLTECSENIQDAIGRLGFVPTGEPTEADNAAVQRLKEIRDASKKIAQVVSG